MNGYSPSLWKAFWQFGRSNYKLRYLDPTVLFLKDSFLIYLFLAVLGLHCSEGFSLVVERWGYSPVVHRLLSAVASLVGKHGL